MGIEVGFRGVRLYEILKTYVVYIISLVWCGLNFWDVKSKSKTGWIGLIRFFTYVDFFVSLILISLVQFDFSISMSTPTTHLYSQNLVSSTTTTTKINKKDSQNYVGPNQEQSRVLKSSQEIFSISYTVCITCLSRLDRVEDQG